MGKYIYILLLFVIMAVSLLHGEDVFDDISLKRTGTRERVTIE